MVAVSTIAGVGGAIGIACSFPDVDFAPAGIALDGEVGSDVHVLVDGSDPGALIASDAGKRIDAAGCTVCDCDGDGFNDLSRAGCAGAGGKNDCDDSDTTTRPDQRFNTTAPYPPRNGDWNCTGGVERFYEPSVTCAGPGGASCDGRFGFEDDPTCGSTGTFVTCKTTGATPPLLPGQCIVASRSLDTVTQACK